MRRPRWSLVSLLSLAAVLVVGGLLLARRAGANGKAGLASAVVGPEGGVPLHGKGRFRSPFANPDAGEAPQARVGFLLDAVRGYDLKTGSFEADFYLSLTSDKPMPEIDLVFTNGHDGKRVIADKPTFKLYHYTGTFLSPPDLRLYPFDTQELTIELEDDDNGIDSIRLVPDLEHTQLDDGFSVAGWEVAYVEARVLNHYYPDRFDNDDLYYPRYVFKLGLRRFATNALFTVYVPAIVIVLISLLGMWIPFDKLEARFNAGPPMLAAAVLFHYALTQSLPPTPYLTRADKLMLAVYLSLVLHILTTWLWFVFPRRWEPHVFTWGKRLAPPLTVAIVLVGVLS